MAAWIAAVAVAARSDAQELTILRYERLAGLTVTEWSNDGAGGAASGTRVSFRAFGTQFAMLLTHNEALTQNLPPEVLSRVAAATFFTGTLENNSESWVRITRIGDALSGALWDGSELYAIESFARVAEYVVTGVAVGPTEPVVYRWSDTLSGVTDIVGSAASDSKGAQKTLGAALFAGLADAQLKLSPLQQLDIGLLADSEFVQLYPAYAEVQMLSIANIVDGIFVDQVGVHVNVAELNTYAESDAFSGSDAAALLNQLEGVKFDTPELRGRGLVHLLTGRDLTERPNSPAGSRLLGVANFGAVCDERLAVSLTQYTDLNTAAVVAAHEIGHNFGAPHDAETGSPCESTADGFIMNPFLNGSRQFSQCSLQQMEAELATAACLTDVPANDLSVQPLGAPGQVVATREFSIDFAVDYGAGYVAKPELTITATNAKLAAIYNGGPARCDFGHGTTASTCTFSDLLATGGRVSFRVELFDPQAGPASVDVEVKSLNDHVPANNRYRFEFDVQPEGHFVLASSAAPAAVKPGEPFDFDWVVVNEGQIAATDVRADFRFSSTLEFIEAHTPSGAACVRGAMAPEHWLCPVGTMAPGATAQLKVKVRTSAGYIINPGSVGTLSMSLKMVAAERVFDWHNEWHENAYVTPTIFDADVMELVVPAYAVRGEDTTVTVRVGNRGPDEAPNVGAYVSTSPLNNGLIFKSATSSRGSCTTNRDGFQCQLGVLAAGETVDVVAQVNAVILVDFGLVASAHSTGSLDSDPTNDERRTLFRVVAAAPLPPSPPPPPPAPTPPPPAPDPPPAPVASGGGGGGAVDLALLLLLIGFALGGRRGRAQALAPT